MKILIFIVAFYISIATAFGEKTTISKTTGSIDVTTQTELKLNFVEFSKITLQNDSMESSLSYLREKHENFMQYHLLMYASKSLQQSSFVEPRAIVFGPDAKFIFTFNGNTKQQGGNAFETVEFSEGRKTFLFREIVFKTPDFNFEETRLDKNEVAFENEKLLISSENPKKCLACHSPSANPIWATYFIWPGAYGSVFNRLFINFDKNQNSGLLPHANRLYNDDQTLRSDVPPIQVRDPFSDKEIEGFKKYVSHKPEHPRYKYLPNRFFEKGVKRFLDGEPLSKIDYSEEISNSKISAGSDKWPSRPNQYFQDKIHDLNQERIIHNLKESGITKDKFKDLNWSDFYEEEIPPGKDPILFWSEKIDKLLRQVDWKGERPSIETISKRLKKNITNEIQMQADKIREHELNLGLGSLKYINQHPGSDYRFGATWVKDLRGFYGQFIDLSKNTDLDKIVIHTQTESVELFTALEFLLENENFNLANYSLVMLQKSPSFYLQGLMKVGEYLGIDKGLLSYF